MYQLLGTPSPVLLSSSVRFLSDDVLYNCVLDVRSMDVFRALTSAAANAFIAVTSYIESGIVVHRSIWGGQLFLLPILLLIFQFILLFSSSWGF